MSYTAGMPTPSDPATRDPLPALLPAARVHTRRGRRTLEFVDGETQSEMLLAHPTALVLAYARAMMWFALFVPQPRHIVMVGLGGGSLLKFCYRHFPQTRITVIEVRADVIALRDQFLIPPDDARLQVLHADAADCLGRMAGSADVLLVDGFDADGLPASLSSDAFYADCRRALRPGGVLVANVFNYDPAYAAILTRLQAAFGDVPLRAVGVAGNNHILLVRQPDGRNGAARRFRFCQRHQGLGGGWRNRLATRLLLLWLRLRRVPA